MNALLRLTRFLDQHGGEFPPPAVLGPLLEAEQAHLRRARAAIDAADEIALGWRHKAVYLERFNLRAADLDLLGGEEAAPWTWSVTGPRTRQASACICETRSSPRNSTRSLA